jgi:hypothetical protein
MRRRSPKSGSPVDQQQEELARRENELRDKMQELQRMIEEAPRVAAETSRRQREELLARANQTGSRLDASLSRDRRWGDEDVGTRRRGALRKERREGRLLFLVLVVALALVVLWLMTRFHW